MKSIQGLRSVVDELKGKGKALTNELKGYNERLTASHRDKIRWERAREIIKQTGLDTQQQLQFHISNLTTMAMEAVFADPYTVTVEFVTRRNKTECDIYFERRGSVRDPMDSTGLGAADVAGFALRVAAWCIQKDKTRPILVLDEPLSHLKGVVENRKAIQMMQEISKRLGIQIISVSDERAPIEDIEDGADKVFRVSIAHDISKVE